MYVIAGMWWLHLIWPVRDCSASWFHARCGYEHDLRNIKFNDGKNYSYIPGGELKMGKEAFAEAQWREQTIPSHVTATCIQLTVPVRFQLLDINRGNRFLSLSAMATQSRGLNKFIVDNGMRKSSLWLNYALIVVILLLLWLSVQMVRLLLLHTIPTLLVPYSLGFRIWGTDGLWMNDGDHVYIEGKSAKPHYWDDSDGGSKYDHKLWSSTGRKPKKLVTVVWTLSWCTTLSTQSGIRNRLRWTATMQRHGVLSRACLRCQLPEAVQLLTSPTLLVVSGFTVNRHLLYNKL